MASSVSRLHNVDDDAMIDEYGAVGDWGLERETEALRENPSYVPHGPPHSPHDLNWHRTQAVSMESQQLPAWAMPQSKRRC
jgi:hypothetical protein